MPRRKEIDNIAAFVHGSLFSLHMLGLVYNLKKKNYLYSAIHAAVGIFDVVGTMRHLETKKEQNGKTFR